MIETKRLSIRHAVMTDIDDIFDYVSNKELMKYEKDQYETIEIFSNVLEYLVEHNLFYVIRIKGNSKVIGHIFLGKHGSKSNNEYNLGYILNSDYHNKGYCTEASKAVLDYGFSVLKANRIRAACNPQNIGSWRVMEKIGLKKEGFFYKRFFIRFDDNGEPIYTDEVVYGLHISNWVRDPNIKIINGN